MFVTSNRHKFMIVCTLNKPKAFLNVMCTQMVAQSIKCLRIFFSFTVLILYLRLITECYIRALIRFDNRTKMSKYPWILGFKSDRPLQKVCTNQKMKS